MEDFKFKSQICTTREQSERLLKLGLKKETADMFYSRLSCGDKWDLFTGIPLGYNVLPCEYLLPAWSLHRLMEIAYNGDTLGRVALNFHEKNISVYYEQVIKVIEYLINIKEFNKDYLE